MIFYSRITRSWVSQLKFISRSEHAKKKMKDKKTKIFVFIALLTPQAYQVEERHAMLASIAVHSLQAYVHPIQNRGGT